MRLEHDAEVADGADVVFARLEHEAAALGANGKLVVKETLPPLGAK